MAAWVASDAVRRGRRWGAWASLVIVTNVLGLLVWLVVRRRSPVVVDRACSRRRLAVAAMTIPLLFAWLIVKAFITTFLVQGARVEGSAMAPTLVHQDRVLVNKFVYERSDPQPGDIVMLRFPLKPERLFVKRVVAAENNLVRIVAGRVFVNDRPIDDSYVPAEYRDRNDWGPEVVPQGYYFVMGDHRRNSSDSRHWGFVPKKYILGRVLYRWWPFDTARSF
jgi:signal peptidase I